MGVGEQIDERDGGLNLVKLVLELRWMDDPKNVVIQTVMAENFGYQLQVQCVTPNIETTNVVCILIVVY
jgi:hypothetical protein